LPGSSGKIQQAFWLSSFILQAIKNCSRGRPWNEATLVIQVASQVYNRKLQYTHVHYILIKPNRKNCHQQSTLTLWSVQYRFVIVWSIFVITADSYFQSSIHICSELRFSIGQRPLNTTLNLTCIIQVHLWSKHKCLSMNRRERRQSTNRKPGYRVCSWHPPNLASVRSGRQRMQTEDKTRGDLGIRLKCDNGATVCESNSILILT